ncbi:DUF3995 domain-containing protein [Dermacoccus sp. PAMC28757]|uniref:DUF3995 domain-containing protein n=1 Tax=Dermacoccus sp. PAMC28757 TaxID=2762331 RepID=UPI00164D8547|nr:DUF3995 domain-containing protein [Dermacoccus sp. PAMC28757]QNK53405.1 DUF3995 domain-containing protein [Dermacoccus sp. PAMC28757]
MTEPAAGRRHRVPGWFSLAAVAGTLHTAITFYWALGGKALLWTMGESFIAKFSDVMWVLFPLAIAKGLGAFAPIWLVRRGWPLRRLSLFVCWTGSAVLIAWGGANTLVGNAVLLRAIHPSGGFDRSTMVGHAWIWDPLFLVWGLGLAVGMWVTRGDSAPVR